MTPRRATPADADALCLLGGATFLETFANDHPGDAIVRYWREAHDPDLYRAMIADPAYAIWVVEEAAGALIGYAQLGAVQLPGTRAGDAELKRIYVLSRWHGSGAGAALFDAVVAHAQATGAARLVLSVYEHNHRAQRFYAKTGFARIGAYDFVTGDFVSRDHVMARPL